MKNINYLLENFNFKNFGTNQHNVNTKEAMLHIKENVDILLNNKAQRVIFERFSRLNYVWN